LITDNQVRGPLSLYQRVFGSGGVLETNLIHQSRKDGSFPPGHNGPYNHIETPVRNTSHWIVALSEMSRGSRSPAVDRALDSAVEYLLSGICRPGGFTFHCRDAENRDKANGLIGQAWAMEALIHASQAMRRLDLLEEAHRLYSLHRWNSAENAWEIRDIFGESNGLDTTFNHQLWFAAIASMLGDDAINQRVKSFISANLAHVALYRDGIIYHLGGRLVNTQRKQLPDLTASAIRAAKNAIRWGLKSRFRAKSAGYHSFNLLALVILSETMPGLHFWESGTFESLIEPLTSERHLEEVSRSKYGFKYNLSGFEYAVVAAKFGLPNSVAQDWSDAQEVVTPLDAGIFGLETWDRWTSLARLYEIRYLRGA